MKSHEGISNPSLDDVDILHDRQAQNFSANPLQTLIAGRFCCTPLLTQFNVALMVEGIEYSLCVCLFIYLYSIYVFTADHLNTEDIRVDVVSLIGNSYNKGKVFTILIIIRDALE